MWLSVRKVFRLTRQQQSNSKLNKKIGKNAVMLVWLSGIAPPW